MGKVTLVTLGFQSRPDPTNPGQQQIALDPNLGAALLATNGVNLNVAVTVDSWTAEVLRAQNQPVPNAITTPALVDTGASGLALDSSIVRQLGLARKGIVTNRTAGGTHEANMYFVSLAFPSTALNSYGFLRATEVNLADMPFKCLIGRETMVNWHIHYNGQSGQVSIAD